MRMLTEQAGRKVQIHMSVHETSLLANISILFYIPEYSISWLLGASPAILKYFEECSDSSQTLKDSTKNELTRGNYALAHNMSFASCTRSVQ